MKRFKRIMSVFGLDLILGFVLFGLSVEAVFEYSLVNFFHVGSAVFGVLSFFGIFYFVRGLISLLRFLFKKMKAFNKSVKE